MNRAERIYRIHALLQDKPRSLATLREELEASRATLIRDIGYMKDFMGAPIDYNRATNGYRYRTDGPKFELPGLWLNESELYALLASERLLRYRDNWYLVAYCEQVQGLRIFSLDRVRQVQQLPEPAQPTDPTELSRFLGASFGIFSGTAAAWAVLRFSTQASRWVADEYWHPDQIGQWIEGRFELQIPYSDPRVLLMDILKSVLRPGTRLTSRALATITSTPRSCNT